MLTGKAAFAETDPHVLMEAVRHHRVKSIKVFRSDVPIDLETIVSKAINPEPSLRYQTAADLRDDLDRFLLDQPILARRTSPLGRCLRWCRRKPKIATASGIAAASLIVATLASTAGWAIVSAANQRTAAALSQSEQTVDVALQSLDGVVDMVAIPSTSIGDAGLDESDDATFSLNPSPHTAKVLESIQPLYERLSQQSPTRPDVIVQMTRANIRLALIQQQLGQSSSAIESLNRGVELLVSRSQKAGMPQNDQQRLLASLSNELGAVYPAESRFDASEAAYHDATLVEALAGVKLRREVRTPRQRIEASSRLQESLDELRPLRRRFPETSLFAVAEVHIWHKLSSIARSGGDFTFAHEQLEKAVAIQTQLVDASPQNMSHRCWRALLYRSLAKICQLQGDEKSKLDAIANAIADLDAIAPSDQDHQFVVQTRHIIQELELQK
jgi:tetratricopeptide (TPR) repeat protein